MSNKPRVPVAREGYVTPNGDTVCERHYEEGDTSFPIGAETDAPQHCTECEALLPTSLTDTGYRYVADTVLRHLVLGLGRAEVLRTWLDKWPDVVPVIWDQLEERGGSDRREVLRLALKGGGLE